MGEQIKLELTSLAHGGEALGRHQGKVVFVADAIPGELVLVEITERKRRYDRARLLEVLRPSPWRVEPPCPHFGTCGGCHLQHIAYPGQLELKRHVLEDQLTHIGREVGARVEPVMGMAEPWSYRSRARYSVDSSGALGFRSRGGQEMVPIVRCPVVHPFLQETFQALEISFPELQALTIQVSTSSGEAVVILESEAEEPPHLEVDIPASIVVQRPGGSFLPLIGPGYLSQELAGKPFRVSAPSFFQVNIPQAERLVEKLLAHIRPRGSEVVLDAYSGVGTYALLLADKVQRVVGIEENPFAHADALHNAQKVNIQAEFIPGRVEEVLSRLAGPFDWVILDPPRQGCHPQAVQGLARLEAARIAYISCDPATLARDLQRFRGTGYALVEVQPIDMFPQTCHIECLALLERLK